VFFILNSLQATLITGTIMMFPASCLNSQMDSLQMPVYIMLPQNSLTSCFDDFSLGATLSFLQYCVFGSQGGFGYRAAGKGGHCCTTCLDPCHVQEPTWILNMILVIGTKSIQN